MKLNKETKSQVHIGSVLEAAGCSYKVTNMWPAGRNGMCVTLHCIKAERDVGMLHRNLYGLTMSSCYGMEIIK